jgi:hypothetical protein
MSELRPVRNSACQLLRRHQLTRRSIVGFWLPLRVGEILDSIVAGRSERRSRRRVVLVLQFLPLDKGRHNAADSVWAVTQMATDGLGDLVQ